jgi:hypothetical protein
MTTRAQRLRLRLFIEGVEIPVISCQIQSQPNSPMAAAIQIPPLAEATRFLPRSLVHLFFFDFYGDAVTLTSSAEQSDRWEQQNELLEADSKIASYKLLFVGDLMGFTWTKTPVSRSIVLQCADPSNYWDYAYQFNNQDIFGPGMKAMFSGGSTNLFTDFLEEPGQAIVRIITTPSQRYPGLKGLLGGIVHLVEAMGGSYYYDKKFAGQNIFFSISELRLRITQMITAYDKDQTAKKLLGGGYDSLFGRSIGSLGDQASFRSVINKLTSVIFHETYGQPCPMYVPGTYGTPSGFERKKLGNIAKADGSKPFSQIVGNAKSMLEGIKELSEALADSETTNIDLGDTSDLIVALNDIQNLANVSARIANAQAPSSQNISPDVSRAAKQCAQLFTRAAQAAGKGIIQLKKKTSSKSKANPASVLSAQLKDIKSALDQVIQMDVNLTPAKKAIPAALKQQIFRPDVWFSAPPRCNVIFPDQYFSLSYARSFMQEPTRLLLKTNDEFFGEDELFDNFYFAPKAVTLKQEQNTLQSVLRGDILDHELFTGILPVFEKMGEFNIFAARSGMVDGKMPKVGLAQRSTNFLYFKYRFAARQLQVTGRFNPYVAAGFPGLVLDKYIDIPTVRQNASLMESIKGNQVPPSEILSLFGTHFLANFTEVTHNVDQRQGVTSLNCSYARQAEESVEFLGNVQQEITAQVAQKGKTATVQTAVASIYPPKINSQGPNFGKIVAVNAVYDKYITGQSFQTAPRLPVFGGKRDPKTKQLTSQVPVGFTLPAKEYGEDISELVGDPDLVVLFQPYEITEEKTQTRTEKVELPPEEYIRPGWYGDCWHPGKISEVYYDFFNTGAITEPIQTQNSDADGSKGSFKSSNASEDLAAFVEGIDANVNSESLVKLALAKDANIQQAVTYLVLTYSIIRQAGFDADDFIKSYTWRPIASMFDIFGSSDLQLDPSGAEVVQGIEGFHSRAFGPFDDLFGLVTSDIQEIVGIKKGSPQAQKADTRKRKLAAVLQYAYQLRSSRAILG